MACSSKPIETPIDEIIDEFPEIEELCLNSKLCKFQTMIKYVYMAYVLLL